MRTLYACRQAVGVWVTVVDRMDVGLLCDRDTLLINRVQ